jgi:uncharacterized membrane protein
MVLAASNLGSTTSRRSYFLCTDVVVCMYATTYVVCMRRLQSYVNQKVVTGVWIVTKSIVPSRDRLLSR